MTAIFVVSGLAIPALLAHIKVIEIGALLMSISGGIVVYATILVCISINISTFLGPLRGSCPLNEEAPLVFNWLRCVQSLRLSLILL
jgi:hypothetical protein